MADYTLSANITGDSSSYEEAVRRSEQATRSFSERISGISSQVSSVGKTISAAGDKITSFGKSLTVVSAGLTAGVAAGVKYNGTIEQLETSFEVMTGSADKAAEIVEKLQKIGAETPFEFTDLANTTNMLMQFGFTADDAIESMQMLGDISQGSAQKMDSIARAYGKMSSAGKVSLEDINMMIDAGFNPLQEISESTGESMQSLYERISDGALSVDEITAAMQRSTSEGGKYFQSMEKQSQTFNGQMSTLSDNAQSLLGNVTEGFFHPLTENVLPEINNAISAINDAFTEGGFQGAADAIVEMYPALDGIVTKVEDAASALNDMGISPEIFAGIVAAARPATLAIGKIVSISGSALGAIGTLGSGISDASSRLSIFASNMRAAGSNGTVLSGIMTKLTSPMGITIAVVMAVAAAFAYLMATNDDFRDSVLTTVSTILSSLQPVIAALITVLGQIATIIGTTIATALQTLAPLLSQIMIFVAQLMAQLMPLVAQLISQLAPVLTTIMTAVSQIISALLPPLVEIISQIMSAVEALLPPIMDILTTVVEVISGVIDAIMPIIPTVTDIITSVIDTITPIIAFIAGVIADIIEIITPIIEFIAGVIQSIISVITPIASTVASVFSGIFSTVSSIMSQVASKVTGVFSQIQGAWNGLTSFVSGVFSGIGNAVDSLVSSVKGVINSVIGGINSAIGIINKIPGVEIGMIPYLAHGTDNWMGGFAIMNEGGRGELVNLPNGSQVIPHDISVKYAKESAKANAMVEPVDLTGIMEGVVIQVINNTSVDGTPLRETISDYTIRKIGNQQRAVARSRGVLA